MREEWEGREDGLERGNKGRRGETTRRRREKCGDEAVNADMRISHNLKKLLKSLILFGSIWITNI